MRPDIPPRRKALTPKENTFARLYVETGNATEAYRQAYDHNGNDTTACNDAHDVLHREPVTAYVADLQAEHRERHKVTVDGLTWELEQARILAMDAQRPRCRPSWVKPSCTGY